MSHLSFIEFLCLNEDDATIISNLTIQRQQLLLRKANMMKQIDQQIANLDKQIESKQRALQPQQSPQQSPQAPTDQQPNV